jgi:hypothetical protein
MAGDLLSELRGYLVAQGIVRLPRTSGSPLPPCWIEDRRGLRAPGEPKDAKPGSKEEIERGADLVVGIEEATEIPPRRHEGFITVFAVDITYRARTTQIARNVHKQIRDAIVDKRAWMLGSIRIEESLMFRGRQRLRASDQSFDSAAQFTFETWS